MEISGEYDKLLVPFQGSEEFCGKLKCRLSSLKILGVIEISPNRREFEKQETLLQHSHVIAHSKVGGITDGSWSLRSDLKLELRFTAVQRNLGLICVRLWEGGWLTRYTPLMTIFKELWMRGVCCHQAGSMSL